MRRALLILLLLTATAAEAQLVCPADPPLRIEKGPYRRPGHDLTSEEFDAWLGNVRYLCENAGTGSGSGGASACIDLTGATSAGCSLVEAADAAAQRAALGLGTAATQAAAAFAAAAHTHPSTDISDSTAAGRTLLNAADAAAQRTALGVSPPLVNVTESTPTTTAGIVTLHANTQDAMPVFRLYGSTATPVGTDLAGYALGHGNFGFFAPGGFGGILLDDTTTYLGGGNGTAFSSYYAWPDGSIQAIWGDGTLNGGDGASLSGDPATGNLTLAGGGSFVGSLTGDASADAKLAGRSGGQDLNGGLLATERFRLFADAADGTSGPYLEMRGSAYSSSPGAVNLRAGGNGQLELSSSDLNTYADISPGVVSFAAAPAIGGTQYGTFNLNSSGLSFNANAGDVSVQNTQTGNTLTLSGSGDATLHSGAGNGVVLSVGGGPTLTMAAGGNATLTSGNFVGALTGNASTATALAGNPSDCAGGQFATTIAANGDLTCAAVTASNVGLGNVTNDAQTKAAIMPNTAPSAGQIPVGNAGGTAYAPQSMSGDCSLSSAGAITCTKTSGTSFGPIATTAGATDDTVPTGNGSSFDLKAIPNCTDSGGSHLNYTAATNTWSCGTSGDGTAAAGSGSEIQARSSATALQAVTGSSTANGGIALVNQSASAVPFSITGASSQSGNYINITTNGGTAGDVLKIAASGLVATFGGNISTAGTVNASHHDTTNGVVGQANQGFISLFGWPGSNGGETDTGSTHETLTLSTSGTTTATSASLAAARTRIDAIAYRIQTTITTAASFTIKVTGGNAFCSIGTATTTQSTLTAGTTGVLVPCAFADQYYTSAATLTVTTNANPGAGAIKLIVYSTQYTAPTG